MSPRRRSASLVVCALIAACSGREPGVSSTSSEAGEGGPTTDALPTTSEATTDPAATTSASETGGASDYLVLDPSTLVFFDLPIDSIRYAVGGFDPDHGLCAAIIFFDPGAQQHCDDLVVGDTHGFPYVVITPAAAPPCMNWDYAGNVQLDAASGCFQLLAPFPADAAIDMTLQVSGAPFTGTIVVASK